MKVFLAISISVLLYSNNVVIVHAQKNNVCKSVQDYDTKYTNANCWYNPDVDLSVPDVITRNKYPLEIYKVFTKDGYILKLFRIPYGYGKKEINSQPIFLQHGIFASSAPWVINGNNSIGFILSDMGYDVWLGNSRGSQYGKGHVRYKSNEARYWNFSYHEMGVYDLPASLDLVYKVTGRNDIIFVGQSMGTNLPYVYASSMANHANKRLKLIISLAPTVFPLNVKTPLAWLAPYWPLVQNINKFLMVKEVLPNTESQRQLLAALCFNSQVTFVFCESIMFLIFGFDFVQLPAATLPLLYAHYPAGTSLNTLLHLAQGVLTGKFEHFDHGTRINLQYYQSVTSPSYDLQRIQIPSYIMYAANDWVATEQGAMKLNNNLPLSSIGLQKLSNDMFNHVDFFFAKDVVDVVVNNVLRIANKYKV